MKNRNFTVDPSHGLPGLLSVSEVNTILPDRCIHYLHQHWIINCGLIQKKIFFKVGTEGEEWRPYHCPNLHLFRPGVRVWENHRQAAGEQVHGLTIHFADSQSATIHRTFGDRYCYYEFQDHENLGKDTILKMLESFQHNGLAANLKIQALFLSLLDLMLKSEPVDRNLYRLVRCPPPHKKDTEFSDAVGDYLRRHLAEKIDVSLLARMMCVSASHLHHRYKEETGVAPMQTLHKLRLEAAKTLLIQGFPVATIAEETGFYDPFHLSKAFKKHFGLSPRNFLTKYQASPPFPS